MSVRCGPTIEAIVKVAIGRCRSGCWVDVNQQLRLLLKE